MKLQPVLVALLAATCATVFGQTKLYKKLDKYSSSLSQEFDQIPSERKEKLSMLADELVRTSMAKEGKIAVLFASQDNAGMSQMAQAWLQVASERYALPNIQINSAGEKESAIDKSVIRALKNAGFKTENNSSFVNNPRYVVSYKTESNSLLMFSKKYTNFQVPTSDFVAVATENGLANVPGESAHMELPFAAISSEDAQCREVAREMFFLAEKLQSKHLLSHKQ